MLSWPLIRNICLALLLLPLAHFAWVVGSEHARRQAPGPEVWQAEVDAYTREAQTLSLPADPVLVAGGRQVKLWAGLDRLLAPRPVLMRGLGDATVDDLIYHYSDLIGYYRPESLILLVGNSEFQQRDDKEPTELLQAVQQFAAIDREHRPSGQLYLIGPVKTPFYPEDHRRIAQANTLLAAWAAGEPGVSYLDPAPVLEDAEGEPDGSYFRPGGQYLNRQGYLRLGVLLRAALEARETPHTPAESSVNSIGSSANAQ